MTKKELKKIIKTLEKQFEKLIKEDKTAEAFEVQCLIARYASQYFTFDNN